MSGFEGLGFEDFSVLSFVHTLGEAARRGSACAKR